MINIHQIFSKKWVENWDREFLAAYGNPSVLNPNGATDTYEIEKWHTVRRNQATLYKSDFLV